MSIPLLFLLAGCYPFFETVDEACEDGVPGNADDVDAEELYQRVNCYRRVARMKPGQVNRRAQDAAEYHVLYLENVHGEEYTFDSLHPLLEDDTLGQPFTGVTVWERLEYQGYPITTASHWIWEFWDTDAFEAFMPLDQLVDEVWITNPYWRQAMLHPGWRAAGHATTQHWRYGLIIADLPSRAHASRPIVYPADGQTGLPLTWTTYAFEIGDGLPIAKEVGLPITVHVGGETYSGGHNNPYELVFDAGSLHGPDGELPFYPVEPDATPSDLDLPSTVIMVPMDPLEPDTTYTATFQISWNDNWRKDVETTFTTAPAGSGQAARVEPPMPPPVLRRPTW